MKFTTIQKKVVGMVNIERNTRKIIYNLRSMGFFMLVCLNLLHNETNDWHSYVFLLFTKYSLKEYLISIIK
jgi:hypothetical protein